MFKDNLKYCPPFQFE